MGAGHKERLLKKIEQVAEGNATAFTDVESAINVVRDENTNTLTCEFVVMAL